jgi:hypothetical protein
MSYRLIDPDAKLDYAMDWSDWLAEGDAISTHQWSITPQSGSPTQPTLTNDTQATVTVQGFEAGKVYVLTDKITTTAGLIDERSITLRAGER